MIAKWGSISSLLLLASGCVVAPENPNGCIALSPAIPLEASLGRGCATQVNEHWAVTDAHVWEVARWTGIEKVETDYPFIFFRHEGKAPAWARESPRPGAQVTAYGNPRSVLDYLVALPVPTRETAHGQFLEYGTLCKTKDETFKRCAPVIWLKIDATHGYSGGPIVDRSGAVIGITEAGGKAVRSRVVDGVPIKEGDTLTAAFPASLVLDEFERLGLSKMKVGKDEP